MKSALNNQNIKFQPWSDCSDCHFINNRPLCFNLAFRDHRICRSAKILDDTPLNNIFQI